MNVIEESTTKLKNQAKELKTAGKNYSEIGRILNINKETARRYVLDIDRSKPREYTPVVSTLVPPVKLSRKGEKIKRLFLDIETTPNTVFTWNTGWKLTIPVENIVEERKIICIGYKWQHEKTVKSLQWDENQSDKAMLEEFVQILESATEVVGHNSDRFDLPWIRTRCIYHGISLTPYLKQVDTLKMARKSFRFNSNKLNYISEFLGLGSKLETDFGLWRAVLAGDLDALNKMVKYCRHDIHLTEKIYLALESYGILKTHAGVLSGGEKRHCPRCASKNTQKRGQRVSAAGTRTPIMHCRDCGRHFTVSESSL